MLSKRDLDNKVYGLDQYRPGMEGLRDLAFRITSGTTGLPSLVVISRANTEAKRRFIVKRGNDFLFTIPKRVSYFKWMNDFLRPINGQRPIRSFMSADLNDMKTGRYEFLLSAHTPDAVVSFPSSYILESLQYLSAETRARLAERVKLVVTGGEMVASVEREHLKKAFPRAEMRDIYGCAECDLFSISCPILTHRYRNEPCAVFHPFDEDYKIEIVEPDEEGFGEIVVSSPELPRYRIGDIGALREEVCACGMRRTLLVAGRKDYDRIAVFGVVFLASLLMKAIEPFAQDLEDYLMEVRAGAENNERRGFVELLVIPKNGILSPILTAQLAQVLGALQVSKTRTLHSFVESGLFAAPRVTVTTHIKRESPKKIRLRRLA